MREDDTHTRHEPLSPDADAPRRARINKDLIEIFRRPCSADARPSMQGIGLYTHVAGPPVTPPQGPHMHYAPRDSNPVFLHVGGPTGMLRESDVLLAPVGDDVNRAWRAVQQAVDKEVEHVAQTDLDMGSLKERYGALDEKAKGQLSITHPHSRGPAMADIQDTVAGVDRQVDAQRLSVGSGVTREVTMTGADEERYSSRSVVRSGNDYEAARDPRLRAR